MRTIITFFIFLLTFFTLKGQDLRLSYVNGRATVKKASTNEWHSVSNRDAGLSMELQDSVCVLSNTLYIDAYRKGEMIDSYWADTGNWTVKDIIAGKAYNTNRPKEKVAESMKGEVDFFFFDILVHGEETVLFHYGDHPVIRLINDSDSIAYYALLWLEGQSGWNMLASSRSLALSPKTSQIVATRESFVIGPPEGNGDVIWVISDAPFDVVDAIKDISSKQNNLFFLVKNVIIKE